MRGCIYYTTTSVYILSSYIMTSQRSRCFASKVRTMRTFFIALDKIINILNNISGYKYHISDLSTYVFKFLCFFSNEPSRDIQCHVYHMYLTCIFLVLNDNMDHGELHAVAAVVI